MKKIILLVLLAFTMLNLKAQWQQTSCPYPESIRCIAVCNSTVIAGSWEGYIYTSSDNGTHWTAATHLPFVNESLLQALAVKGNRIFAGTSEGIFLSTDYGATWTPRSNGLTYTNVHAIDFIDSSVIAGCWAGLYKSVDNGVTWTDITHQVPYDNWINCLTVHDTVIYAGASNYDADDSGGVFMSADKGASWTAAAKEADYGAMYPISGMAYKNNALYALSEGGVYRSYDNGKHWYYLNNLPLNYAYNKLLVSGINMFAYGTGHWMALSSNDGRNWTDISSPANINVNSLTVNGTTVLLATDSGVWKTDLSAFKQFEVNFTIAADSNLLHHYNITDGSYGRGALTYIWNWGDGKSDSIPAPSHTYANPGYYTICLTVTDTTGYYDTYCDSSFHGMRSVNSMVYITVNSPIVTGLSPVIESERTDVGVYPNPAWNELFIKSERKDEIFTVSIMNTVGQMLSPPLQMKEGQARMDVTGLSAGIYFLQLKSVNESLVKKFVKE